MTQHGTLSEADRTRDLQPVLSTFHFEQPKPKEEVRPHLVPEAVAETTQEPSKVIEKKQLKRRRKKQPQTASRAKPRAKPVPPVKRSAVASAIAPPTSSSSASTVAATPEPAPKVASGPTTRAAGSTSEGGERSNVNREGLLKAYVKQLSKAVRKRRNYPRAAKLAGLEGRAVVRIVLNETGAIVTIELAHSSGHDILDRAALEAARSVGKLPAAPSGLHWGTRAIKIPFSFKVAS